MWFYFLNMKVMNIVKNIKFWKVKKKKLIKNMYILFKDILIICFCFFCLISVFCLIFINDFCVDML